MEKVESFYRECSTSRDDQPSPEISAAFKVRTSFHGSYAEHDHPSNAVVYTTGSLLSDETTRRIVRRQRDVLWPMSSVHSPATLRAPCLVDWTRLQFSGNSLNHQVIGH